LVLDSSPGGPTKKYLNYRRLILLSASVSFGSVAAYRLRLCFVGLPDKFHIQMLDRLPIDPNFHAISLQTADLGAYRTPNLAELMLLSNVLFQLIFTASKV
jgi:hypothetical protein